MVCRIAITLSADVPMDFEQRVEAVAAAERFQNDPTGVTEDSREQQDSTAAQILLAARNSRKCPSPTTRCARRELHMRWEFHRTPPAS